MYSLHTAIDFTNSSQCKVRQILPHWCFNGIKNSVYFPTIKTVLEHSGHLAYTRYVANYKLTHSYNLLNQVWGMFRVGDFKKLASGDAWISPRTLRRLESQVHKYIHYVNERLHFMLDVGLTTFHSLLNSNEYYRISTVKLLNADFVKIHNESVKALCSDTHVGIPNAIETVMTNTSQEQYQLFRTKVCLL